VAYVIPRVGDVVLAVPGAPTGPNDRPDRDVNRGQSYAAVVVAVGEDVVELRVLRPHRLTTAPGEDDVGAHSADLGIVVPHQPGPTPGDQPIPAGARSTRGWYWLPRGEGAR
jgi:hypothetical protein